MRKSHLAILLSGMALILCSQAAMAASPWIDKLATGVTEYRFERPLIDRIPVATLLRVQ